MGRARRQVAAALVACTLAGATARTSRADAVIEPPRTEGLRFGGDRGLRGGALAELRAIGPMASERLATWPDRGLGLERGAPMLVAARGGVVIDFGKSSLTLVAVIDLAEAARPERGGERPWADEPTAFGLALVDDLALWFSPRRGLRFTLGRQRVPLTLWRTADERDLPLGVVPFLVDRRVPDRRVGLTISGDLGALAYATGLYEDLDGLELRHPDDPSARGAVIGVASLRWTPLAPLYGSNPPGRVTGATSLLPTPPGDPWYGTARVALDLGILARADQDGNLTTQLTAGLAFKWRWFAFVGEALSASDTSLGADGELMVAPWPFLSLHARGEWDGSLDGTATLGGGAAWHATDDRRSRIAVVGWSRRDLGRGPREDAVLVLLQASL